MTKNMDTSLEVRLADCEREVRAAQALRYRVFYEDMGACASPEVKRSRLDIDRFDAYCDHLLVLDHKTDGTSPRIVGTYRLLKSSRAEETAGFYSAGEYDLAPLDKYPGEKLELGRSCVDPAYRGKCVLQMLWKGLSRYLQDHRIDLMFGCASFPGTDLGSMATALSYLAYEHAAPTTWRPRAVAERYIDLRMLARRQVDPRQAVREMPPLIKGYLRAGGVIGDGAVIDAGFNTVDVCLLVETDQVADKYRRHAPKYGPVEADQTIRV